MMHRFTVRGTPEELQKLFEPAAYDVYTGFGKNPVSLNNGEQVLTVDYRILDRDVVKRIYRTDCDGQMYLRLIGVFKHDVPVDRFSNYEGNDYRLHTTQILDEDVSYISSYLLYDMLPNETYSDLISRLDKETQDDIFGNIIANLTYTDVQAIVKASGPHETSDILIELVDDNYRTWMREYLAKAIERVEQEDHDTLQHVHTYCQHRVNAGYSLQTLANVL